MRDLLPPVREPLGHAFETRPSSGSEGSRLRGGLGMILASARALYRTLPLVLVSSMDVLMPLIRMLALSHFLSLSELGLASLLAATAATYEQVTEIAVYRYVLSSPREVFHEALAAAHALAVTRGFLVGGLAAAISIPVATLFSSRADWGSFAMLGLIIVTRPFENLQPRVAERDYNYDVQFKVGLVANCVSLAALTATLLITRSHVAVIASLLGQAVGLVAASQWFSTEPFRLRFRSPEFIKALKFSYPLLLGGVGLAVSGQADRLLVGGMLGLPALGVYSVLTLAALIPISPILRILNSVTVAILINARRPEILFARLKLAARVVPLMAGVYAVGVATLLNIVTPLVFGHRFVGSRWMVALLATSAFVRFVRSEPGSSTLLYRGRTKRLAFIHVVALSSVVFAYALIRLLGNSEAAVAGRTAGDVLALLAMLYVTRPGLGGAFSDNIVSIVAVGAVVVSVSASVLGGSIGAALGPSLAVLAAFLAATGLYIAVFAPRMLTAAAFRSMR